MTFYIRLLLSLWHQPHTPEKLKRFAYKALLKRDAAPAFHFRTDFFGLQYEGDFDNHIDFDIYYFGAFEKPILFFMRDYLKAVADQAAVFVDIGANIGQHSLFVSRLVSEVHAFEPYDKVGNRLRHQIALNTLDNIHLHAVGISDENGRQAFFAPTGRNLGIGSFDTNTTNKGNQNIGELQLVNGDDYFQELGIERIDVMKIDVEGLEKKALAGLEQSLKKFRPLVLLELTYGQELSFVGMEELAEYFPGDYQFYCFDKRKKDGRKSRRKEGAGRISGRYRLIPFHFQYATGQDDIVACPTEKAHLINTAD